MTVFRTLFYQFFILFVGISIGFILNAEYVGWKYPSMVASVRNTFFAIDFEDEGVLQWLYNTGRFKICAFNGYPQDFTVIEEAMCAEEWYWCKYSYTDKNGDTKINIDHTRIRWKPWEYYYEDEAREPTTPEELRKYLKEGTLNSRDTDRAFRLRDEMRDMERSKTNI
jgi:hypothetical protein